MSRRDTIVDSRENDPFSMLLSCRGATGLLFQTISRKRGFYENHLRYASCRVVLLGNHFQSIVA